MVKIWFIKTCKLESKLRLAKSLESCIYLVSNTVDCINLQDALSGLSN